MLIVIYLVWYTLFAKEMPSVYRKIEPHHKKIVTILFLLTIFPAAWGLIWIGVFLVASVLIAYWAFKKSKNKSVHAEAERQYYEEYRDQKPTGKSLTKSVPKRRKIVKSFDRKYNLDLTDEQIDRIVDASYTSYGWEREIIDMDKEYATISQWYASETGWLRAYFHAFHVQSVTSDFSMQRQIVIDSFENVFLGVQMEFYGSIDECIAAVNDKFMTGFNDTTFMIAYRFLRENGRDVRLPKAKVANADASVEDLMRCYDTAQAAPEPNGARAR